jgi:predicted lipase
MWHSGLLARAILDTGGDPVRRFDAGELAGVPHRVVAFGGTRTLRDLLDDLDVRQCRPWAGAGHVHCGMAHRAMRLFDDSLFGFCSEQPIVLAGYSLGGGAANLFAAQLCLAGVDVRSVHTFGAPRVGDAAFARWYTEAGLGSRTLRFETPRDPVVRLPGHPYVPVGRRVVLPLAATRSAWAHHDLRAYADALTPPPETPRRRRA